MLASLAPVRHILPLTTIRRERTLRSPGKVMVRKGQRVAANDIIAEANLAPEHLLLDIARGLGLRAEQADEFIQVSEGGQVAEGDLVAGPVGMTRRVVRSPRDGRVVLAGSGQVLIEIQTRPFTLKAGLPGEVIELIPDHGAIVETTGSLIQGVWGNGMLDYGLLSVLAQEPDQVLTTADLDVSYRGTIILSGHCASADVLKAAADIPVRGMILASMDPALVPLASKFETAVLLIEGFGQRPMNSAAFKLLATNERRDIALVAEQRNPYAGTQPEIIIPLPAPGTPALPRETDFFAPGQQVRIVRAPHFGKLGTLEALSGQVIFPSGIRAPAADIRLEDGEQAVLPLANLEVLE